MLVAKTSPEGVSTSSNNGKAPGVLTTTGICREVVDRDNVRRQSSEPALTELHATTIDMGRDETQLLAREHKDDVHRQVRGRNERHRQPALARGECDRDEGGRWTLWRSALATCSDPAISDARLRTTEHRRQAYDQVMA